MKGPGYDTYLDVELAFRVRVPQTTREGPSLLEAFDGLIQSSGYKSDTRVPHGTEFSQVSTTDVATLRNLPATSNILLFTPVIIPAGDPAERNPQAVKKAFERQGLLAEERTSNSSTESRGAARFNAAEAQMSKVNTIDPFEVFGRALSSWHPFIRHVPYVAQQGFTPTHETFVSQADAIITVMAEPDWDKDKSMTNQMDFAEKALDALERKDTCTANVLVLVQCGADQYRLPVDPTFRNVIQCHAYSPETARAIARTIFEGTLDTGSNQFA